MLPLPPHLTQAYPMTCGPASIRIALHTLGHTPLPSEEELRKHAKGSTHRYGTTARGITRMLNRYIAPLGHTISKETGDDCIVCFEEKIQNSSLAIALRMVDRKSNPHNRHKKIADDLYGLHRSVITDAHDTHVTVLNPFGYTQHIPTIEWRNRRSLHSTMTDTTEEMLLSLGVVAPRTIFYIT